MKESAVAGAVGHGRFAHRLIVATAVVCALAFVVSFMLFLVAGDFPYYHDDAYIVFTYADNLAKGNGLVFNPGERVWGFTSPLHVLLLAGVTALGFETPAACYTLSVVWIGLTSLLLFSLTQRLVPRLVSLLIAIYFFNHGGGYYLGLESSLLFLLQVLFLWLIQRRRPHAAALVASLSCLARPDSLLLVGPILLLTRELRTWRSLALFAVPGLAWLTFTFFYYDALLPNSLSAKQSLTPFAAFFARGFAWFSQPGGLVRVVGTRSILLSLMLIVLSLGGAALLRDRRRWYLVYALVFYPWVLLLGYSFIGSFDSHVWEIYSGFMFFNLAWLVGLGILFALLLKRLRQAPLLDRWWIVLPATLALLWLFGSSVGLGMRHLRKARSLHFSGLRHFSYIHVARWMRQNIPPDQVVAVGEVGTLGYHTDHFLIDHAGIITRGLKPGDRMHWGRVVRRFKPDWVLVSGNKASIQASPTLGYRRVHYFPTRGYRAFSMLRRIVTPPTAPADAAPAASPATPPPG